MFPTYVGKGIVLLLSVFCCLMKTSVGFNFRKDDSCWGHELKCKTSDSDNYICLPREYICDGVHDCVDNSDEIDCTGQVCLEGEFVCSTEYGPVCQPNTYKCDGEQDCLDNYDEAACHGQVCLHGEFLCSTKFWPVCQPDTYKCDGEQDCLDNYDEAFCNGRNNMLAKRSGFYFLDYLKDRVKQKHQKNFYKK